jgi:hypothetical protein
MSRISSLPGFTVVPNWSMRASHSRAASVLRGAFSRRLMVDCEASAHRSPDSGRPRASSADRAAIDRGRWHPRARRRSPKHATSPSRTSHAGRGPDRGDPALFRRAAGKHHVCAPPTQQQHTAIGRLIAARKIDGEFLTSDRGQVERKRRIVSHGGCGAGLIREATRGSTTLLCESAPFATPVSEIHMLVPNLGYAGRAGGRWVGSTIRTKPEFSSLRPLRHHQFGTM